MSGRYDVLSEIGSSSTGVVYLVRDRLTGLEVAMRVITAAVADSPFDAARDEEDREGEPTTGPAPLGFADRRQPSARPLRLLWQLRRIAALRHPHLAGVLDYGIDRGQWPFFTHRLIEDPVELLVAARDRPLLTRLDLMIQMLLGLQYLHRHGAVHGDLRSRTALLDGDELCLVNFGLAALRRAESPAEAVYLAPEVRRGQPATAATDLYSAGILAYQMFSGRVVDAEDLSSEGSLPISTRDVEAPLIPVVEKLLAADPRQRYDDASLVIRDLCTAFDQPTPPEKAAVRESFLEAARFVAREDELNRLVGLLQQAADGSGQAVLVSGESGVGKSRLIEELRLVGLATHAVVLSGRAASEGFRAYHSWRGILSHLCLLIDVTPEEVAVLDHHLPGLARLLEVAVTEPPTLDPLASQQRFVDLVAGLFARLDQPTVMILEDLHWAGSETLELLLDLHRRSQHLPILFVATFRDDERPDLAQRLEAIPRLQLERFRKAEIASFAESVLGSHGSHPELVAFLQRETEGNAFFLVEIVRALAENAGWLDRIDVTDLPEQVTTGGIERVLKRRLERLPKRVRPLLRLAAVAGREIDGRLLQTLEPGVQLQLWLRFCADQAVLETSEGQWRFASDRYREALVADLSGAELRAVHRTVAEAITATHGKGEAQVPLLAYHWGRAADLEDPEATALAVEFLERAAKLALQSGALREAEELLGRGLELLDTLSGNRDSQECRLQLAVGGTYLMSRGFTAAEVAHAFGRARSLCERLGRPNELMPTLLGLWRFHVTRAELETARELADEMAAHADQQRLPLRRLLADYVVGSTHLFRGEPEPGFDRLRRALDGYGKLRAGSGADLSEAGFFLGQHPGVAAFADAGWAAWLLGYPDHAVSLNRRAMELAGELGHSFSRAYAFLQEAWLDQMRGDPEATAASSRAVVESCHEQAFPSVLAVSRIFHGWARAKLGDAEAGVDEIRRALDRLRAAGAELFRPTFHGLLAEALAAASHPEEGLEVLRRAIREAERYGSGYWLPELERLRGELNLGLPSPRPRLAARCFEAAVSQARARRERSIELRAWISLAQLEHLGRADRARVMTNLDSLYRGFSEGHHTRELAVARELLGDGISRRSSR